MKKIELESRITSEYRGATCSYCGTKFITGMKSNCPNCGGPILGSNLI